MKLAEALMIRAQHKQDIENLKKRIQENVRIQEGDDPLDNPTQLVAKAEAINDSLLDLVKRINTTNTATRLEDGMLLSSALAERDALLKQRSIYKAVIDGAQDRRMMFSRDEIRRVLTVDVSEYQQAFDKLSAEYRSLDARIQAANWNAELI